MCRAVSLLLCQVAIVVVAMFDIALLDYDTPDQQL
jgi:hypothetical protein